MRTVMGLTVSRAGEHQPIWDPKTCRRQQLSFIDIERAYFNAKINTEASMCFVELPPEDPDHGKTCGQPLRHMYGTRAAADGWQEECSTFFVRIGFRQGSGNPNVFVHKTRHISVSVHGVDLTASGPVHELDWYENRIGEEYEISIQPRMGPGPGDAKEAGVFNRAITWRADGIEYEADPRKAARLIEECGLTGAHPMSTPGVKISHQEHSADAPLPLNLHAFPWVGRSGELFVRQPD